MNALKDYFKNVISFRMAFHSECHFIQNITSFRISLHSELPFIFSKKIFIVIIEALDTTVPFM